MTDRARPESIHTPKPGRGAPRTDASSKSAAKGFGPRNVSEAVDDFTGRAIPNSAAKPIEEAKRRLADLPAAWTTNIKGERFKHPTLVSRYDVLVMLEELTDATPNRVQRDVILQAILDEFALWNTPPKATVKMPNRGDASELANAIVRALERAT